jgi:outer membrane receptor protein involved in Fe transport
VRDLVVNKKLAVAAAFASLLVLSATRVLAGEPDDDDDDEKRPPLTEIVVTSSRLDIARANVEPSLGASTYTLSNEAVESRPGSETVSVGQILLQAPGVTQDGSGQLRVRSQGDLQYRINNVILPEGFTDLGESLSARLADRIQLVTGALPAQYGLHAGGVVNITTKSGAYQDGGQAELYGGGHGEFEPAFEYAGSAGQTNYFLSGSYLRSDVGLNSPDGGANPIHDRTDQIDGFAFVDHIIDDQSRVSLIAGTSDERFQLPELAPATPSAAGPSSATPRAVAFQQPLMIDGFSSLSGLPPSGDQRQNTQYGIVSYLRTTDQVTLQASGFTRYSTLNSHPDALTDLFDTGLSQSVVNSGLAVGLQFEAVYQLSAAHALRAGLIASSDREVDNTRSLVLPVDALGRQTSQSPESSLARSSDTVNEASFFLQDEWRPSDQLTVNLGFRFDDVRAATSGAKVSPRINLVWNGPSGITLHAGYARYFVPAPQNEIADTPGSLAGTTGAPPTTQGSPLRSETDDYYDLGFQQKLGGLTIGLDGYWRHARNLIDQASIGAGSIPQAFNYEVGRVRGLEWSVTYASGPFSAWSNIALAEAEGKGIVSDQFGFTPVELAFVASHFVHLDHDQTYTASAGASYRWGALRLSSDLVYGSGQRRTLNLGAPNDGQLPGYLQVNFASVFRMDGVRGEPLDLRLDLINAFDRRYEIRDGTALGGGVPQWGPRRGLFVGVEQSF